MDNFRIPSLWRRKSPQICGERTAGAGYSNTAIAPEPRRPGSEGAFEAPEGLGEGFRRGRDGFKRARERQLEALWDARWKDFGQALGNAEGRLGNPVRVPQAPFCAHGER
ncbi:hypothetical protein ACFRQM_08210, partial [Streptomyces sp. NPDC056831]|uniref:hypothetical protein n=1 Tax=Streptomyces sp. NPDC056831 TaxID=3345954 RepID=UPI0036B693DA